MKDVERTNKEWESSHMDDGQEFEKFAIFRNRVGKTVYWKLNWSKSKGKIYIKEKEENSKFRVKSYIDKYKLAPQNRACPIDMLR